MALEPEKRLIKKKKLAAILFSLRDYGELLSESIIIYITEGAMESVISYRKTSA